MTTSFDRWLTTQPDDDPGTHLEELTYICPKCGLEVDDHVAIQETDDDGNDYEAIRCPQDVIHRMNVLGTPVCGATSGQARNCVRRQLPGVSPHDTNGVSSYHLRKS